MLAGKQVLTKVTIVHEAQPGLYPLLKPGESRPTNAHPNATNAPNSANPQTQAFLWLPFRPYTAVAFNVVKATRFEIVAVD